MNMIPQLEGVRQYDELKPLKRLWASVLLIGIQDYVKAKQNTLHKWEWHMRETQLIDNEQFSVEWVRDPIKWFESESEEPRCFKWMCQVLGVDARRVRNHVASQLEVV
jgi:hypothetical protein